MTQLDTRPAGCDGHCTADGHPRETWTERDHADAYIVDMMLPLLELADAFPKMIELVGEHLLARFGRAEPEHLRVSDDDVIRVWDNLVSFTDGMQEMLTADRPEAMAAMVRLRAAQLCRLQRRAESDDGRHAQLVSAIAVTLSETGAAQRG